MAIQRMAVVDADHNVVNVIVYDTESNWTPPVGTRIIQSDIIDRGSAAPGGTWHEGKFSPPPESVSSSSA